jgi:hypothetical protein
MYAGGASFEISFTVAMLLNLPVRRRLNGVEQLIVFDMIEREWWFIWYNSQVSKYVYKRVEVQCAIHQAGYVTNARNKSGNLSESGVGWLQVYNDSAPREMPRNILDRSDIQPIWPFRIHHPLRKSLALSKDLHTELAGELEWALTIKYLLSAPH